MIQQLFSPPRHRFSPMMHLTHSDSGHSSIMIVACWRSCRSGREWPFPLGNFAPAGSWAVYLIYSLTLYFVGPVEVTGNLWSIFDLENDRFDWHTPSFCESLWESDSRHLWTFLGSILCLCYIAATSGMTIDSPMAGFLQERFAYTSMNWVFDKWSVAFLVILCVNSF